MIEVKNVTKSYQNGRNRTEILHNISLQIPDGKLTVLCGASGSGKTTLLYLLSGLERPDSGSVTYDGYDIAGLSDRELTAFRRKQVGYVFQQYYLLPDLSIRQNIRLAADLAGNRDFLPLLDAVGLADKADLYPDQLSGGEQQRVAVARALAKNPQILFLDEPTGALDEATGRNLLDYLARLQSCRIFTAVMVTHNQNIENMADTVLRMNSGKIVGIRENPSPMSAYEIGW
ncbi:MAG: ABC transporter ATP-binding protein [Eubacteriales bacterium]